MAALDTSSARDAVKSRLGIEDSDTSFDDLIDDFVLQAVQRLAPKAMQEIAPQNVSITVDSYGEALVDMSADPDTPIDDVRQVDVSAASGYYPANSIYRHGVQLRIQQLDTSITTARLYGLKAYALGTVPDELQLAVFWFAMSEFYDYLAGNKRKYNIFIQSTGARAVDNMRDEATYFEQKAEVFLDDHNMEHGSQ